MAHSRPPLTHLPENLPASVILASNEWLPPTCAADALVDPRLHAQEETCNQQGIYPEQLSDFELVGHNWSYSSLEGLQRSQREARPATPAQAKELGWDGKTPVWGMFAPRGLKDMLPAGLSLSPEVRAVEGRLWPEQRRGQVVMHLSQDFTVSPDSSLEEGWKHLPSAPVMGCLRKEVAGAIFRSRSGLMQRLLNPSEHWLAVSVDTELTASGLQSVWNRVQMGWVPMALWGDFSVSQIASSRDVGMSGDDKGTLYTVGLPPAVGTATRPWEGWQAPGKPENWVGAGRLHWRVGESLRRVEWVAQLEPGQVLVTFGWAEAAPTGEEGEVATMGPDLETLYTPRPNVIAGR
ncbi:hypothetical protein IV102_32220 [bacterium]|nr:hypothetical protein [bacterium]